MSQVRPDIDLSALARPAAELPPPKRGWLRIVVPLAILLVFGVLIASTLGDLWKGSVAVTVVRPRVVDASSTAASGTPLFQAAGWIEPDPFEIEVSALAAGIVSEVLVQPSDVVAKGDVVARLIERDAQLARDGAEAQLAAAQAQLASVEADAKAARANFDAALAVVESEASARAELEGRKSDAAGKRATLARGEAQVRVAESELALQRELEAAGATGARQVELAEARLAEAQAELGAQRAEAARAEAEIAKAEAGLQRARRDLELRIDERRLVESTEALVAAARAAVAAAQVASAEARLRFERMEVRAPADGVVLERRVAPGSKIEEGGAIVCTLYDPRSIRVRVDVPQGDVAKVGVGMQAEVLAESRPGRPYHGEVIRLVHKADIQKVTLQVHVRLTDPDELLRPEMLVQGRFLSSGAAAGVADSGASIVLVPARLVEGSSIWVVDGATRTAVRRTVELGAKRGDEVEVKSGVNESDKLIDEGRQGLTEGARLAIGGS